MLRVNAQIFEFELLILVGACLLPLSLASRLYALSCCRLLDGLLQTLDGLLHTSQ